MKRIFSVFLSLALAVSLFPAALAEESAGMDRGALAQRLAELCGYADELEGYAAVSAHIFRKKRTFSVNARCLHKIIQKKAG